MMKRLLASALFFLAGLPAALGQSSIFPATLPANTVVGRVSSLAGPATAVPIATLTASILYGETPVADANYSVVSADRTIAYSTLTASRTVTLLPASSYAPGARLNFIDRSGNANATRTISLAPTGTDTINGANATLPVVTGPYAQYVAESDGVSKWSVTIALFAGSSPTLTGNPTFLPSSGAAITIGTLQAGQDGSIWGSAQARAASTANLNADIGNGSVDQFNLTVETNNNHGAIITGTTNAITAAGNNILHFAANPTGLVVGMTAWDTTTPNIPVGATITNIAAGAVTLSANVTGGGVGNGDSISFQFVYFGGPFFADAFQYDNSVGGIVRSSNAYSGYSHITTGVTSGYAEGAVIYADTQGTGDGVTIAAEFGIAPLNSTNSNHCDTGGAASKCHTNIWLANTGTQRGSWMLDSGSTGGGWNNGLSLQNIIANGLALQFPNTTKVSSFTTGAVAVNIANIDSGNILQLGDASLTGIHFNGDTGVWTAFTPTVTCSTHGTETVTVNSARFKQTTYVKTIVWEIDATITAAGTGTGNFRTTLPIQANAPGSMNGINTNASKGATGFIATGATTVDLGHSDATNTCATGTRIIASGVYEGI